MSGWHCPTCGTINNTADERGNCKCERDRLVGMLERITASDECDPSVKPLNAELWGNQRFEVIRREDG